MKIRNGFVTNSSSSSFIITKDSFNTNKNLTVDIVFNKIKEIYENYVKQFEMAYSKVIAQHGSNYYQFYKEKYGLSDRSKVFRKKFGVDIYDLQEFDRRLEDFSKWRHCKSYREYAKVAKLPNHDSYFPFEIIDYRECPNNIKNNFTLMETIYWYNEDIEYGDIPEDETKELLLKIGDIGIHSECGYIPDYVVEELAKISVYWCNHMG